MHYVYRCEDGKVLEVCLREDGRLGFYPDATGHEKDGYVLDGKEVEDLKQRITALGLPLD